MKTRIHFGATHPRPARGARAGTRTGRWALALAAWLASAGCGITTAQAADPKSAVANGRKLYMSVGCWQCHGTVGQGGSAGPRLAPSPMAVDALRAVLRNSVRAMPAYPTTILSDEAIAEIHAYLQSIRPAPPAATIPALRDLE